MKGFNGLTKDDVPPTVTREAALPFCKAHPDGKWRTGFGYAGGGFGPYKVCRECDTVFAKVQANA